MLHFFHHNRGRFAALLIIAASACEGAPGNESGPDGNPSRLEEDIRTPDNRAGSRLIGLSGAPLSPAPERLAGTWTAHGETDCSLQLESGRGAIPAPACPGELTAVTSWAITADRPYQLRLLDEAQTPVWRGALVDENRLSGQLVSGARLDFVRAGPAGG